MTIEQIIGLAVALLIMLIGVVGSLLPALPSTPVVLVVAVLHKLYFGDAGAAWWVIGVLAGLTVVSLVLDHLATLYGAKKLGATWKGAVGAVVGGIVGLFFSLPGILLGPFVGAVVFELAGGRNLKESGRAGLGATLGLLAGALGKAAFCAAMMILFAVNVIYNAWP